MTKKLLLQARCEDGENIHLETEWECSSENVIGVFVALGVKIGVELLGDKAHIVYKAFERMFRKLQDKETEAELRRIIEEE